MIGIGICISHRYRRMTANSLTSGLAAALGAKLTGLWIGEDIVINGSNQVTSWPGRVGNTISKNAGVPGFFARAEANGRYGISNDQVATYVRLDVTLTAGASIWSVASPATLPVGDYATLARGSDAWFVGNSGTSSWFSPPAAHYRNGIASEVLTTGVSVYESVASIGAALSFFGGSDVIGAARNWRGQAYAFMLLGSAPTAGERAAAVALLRQYYGF